MSMVIVQEACVVGVRVPRQDLEFRVTRTQQVLLRGFGAACAICGHGYIPRP